MLVKSVHRALNLRHHKHTGKLIHHQHTSYRVLFLLMLLPIATMVLVSHLQAAASSYVVNATVPATMPSGSPVIVSPKSGTKTENSQVTVSGTCPVSNLATVIAIYDGKTMIGSAVCSSDGRFSVPVALTYGTHKLVATIITVTGQTGGRSDPVTITRVAPGLPPSMTGVSYGSPLRIIPSDAYVLILANGDAEWRGTITGGTAPYSVRVDWGDGHVSTYKVTSSAKQTFSHHYQVLRTYAIAIKVHDSARGSTFLRGVAVTLSLQQNLGLGLDTINPPSFSLLALVEQHIWQIYIISLSSLLFLWYLEHGRHLTWHLAVAVDRRHTSGRGARSHRRRSHK